MGHTDTIYDDSGNDERRSFMRKLIINLVLLKCSCRCFGITEVRVYTEISWTRSVFGIEPQIRQLVVKDSQ